MPPMGKTLDTRARVELDGLMNERLILMVEVDADKADDLPEHVTVWGEIDATEAALIVLDMQAA